MQVIREYTQMYKPQQLSIPMARNRDIEYIPILGANICYNEIRFRHIVSYINHSIMYIAFSKNV